MKHFIRALILAGSTLIFGGVATAQRIAPVATEQFHSDAGLEQLWSDANYDALLEAIEALDHHGLNPAHYNLQQLQNLQADKEARERVATAAWLTAATHLLYGKTDPQTLEPSWSAANRQADFATVLLYAMETETIKTSLEAFAPRQPIYKEMIAELARLKANAEKPITLVPDGGLIRPGETSMRVALMRKRLEELSWVATSDTPSVYDEALRAIVEGFQAGEGLEADGIVGPATLRALNRGPAARIDQLRVNMERFRWLPEDLGRRHLRANIASFDVTAYENGISVRTHLTIVGRPYRATPVFSDQIEYIDFNPWWETPNSLARADKLPLFQRDPSAVQTLGFQVLDGSGRVVDSSTIDWNAFSRSNFPYRIRQAPGPLNALGQVKIMFPNIYNVYIHDTPTRGLFSSRQRAFSSGCLRTQDPIDLSKWLLEETDGWTAERVDAALASGRETRARLSSPVPVHILYMTVVSDGAGSVRFLDDIYARDPAVLAGLSAVPH